MLLLIGPFQIIICSTNTQGTNKRQKETKKKNDQDIQHVLPRFIKTSWDATLFFKVFEITHNMITVSVFIDYCSVKFSLSFP